MELIQTSSVFLYFFICFQSTLPLRLLYANQKDIRLFWTNRSSENERVIVSTTEAAVAVDFLYTNHQIFWSDVSEQKIFSCSLETPPCKPQIVVSGDLGRPEGLAVDWVSKKLYWTDCDFKEICVSSIDGKNRKTLIWNNLDNPRAIAVDPRAGLMFWSDWGEISRISRAGMDGSNQTSIVDSFITWPNGLTVDYQENRVYWIDARHHYIACVDYHGDNRRLAYSQAVNHPYALTMLGQQLYWTDWDTNSIRNCPILIKNVTESVNVLKTKIYSPMDIKVYKSQRQLTVPFDPCAQENGGCSHLCLLAPGKRRSCACPSGIALMSDMRTCQDGPQKFLLLAQRSQIRILSLSTEEYRDLQLPIKNIGHVIAVDFDVVKKLVCWIDSQHQEIKCTQLNGLDIRTVAKGENISAESLAIDWINRNLYWTDTASDSIEMSSLNGSLRKQIVTGDLDEPRAIVVEPNERYIYWSDWGARPKLERSKLDGTKRAILINTSIAWPNGLAIDYQQRKLYWADAKLDKIEFCDLTGSNRVILTSENVPHIFGLTLVGQYLFWTDLKTRILGRIDKNNPKDRKIIMDSVANVMAVKGVDLQMRYNLE